MHEYHMVEGLITQAVEAAKKKGAIKITKVVLVVGEKSGIDPDSVRLYFSQASQSTIAESAELVINKVGAYSGQNGREFYIENIEVELLDK